MIRVMIKKMGNDVLNKVEDKSFKGVNDNINKIENAEIEFKSVPGLLHNSVHNKIITQIEKKIEEIVDKTMKKMNKTEVKGVVSDIIELKEWVNNLPVLEKKVDVHVKHII